MIERAQIQSVIDRLKNNERIDKSFCEELDKSFESETLYIGVVGKMKAGKSSLVNAVVFGDEILPSGVAPTTVTLTEIAYSKEEKAIVELLTSQDVMELKEKSVYCGNDPVLLLKAQAALKTLNGFPSGYEKYLNKPDETISLSELHEYIDAKGKYSGLAKSVKIFISNENLKGITIIDTPGFNDPIVSRGETTKKVLSKCHVLLFVHDNDGYDNGDVSLLEEQIEYAGISEIVDVLNKVDLLSDSIDEWRDELNYFIQGRDELSISPNIQSLLSNSHATYVSSLMALCGLIPYDKMDDDMKRQFSSFEEDFEELCQCDTRELQQQDFVKYSNVDSVIAEINRLSKEGSVYLIEGPLKTIKGKLSSIKNTVENEIELEKTALDSLQVSIEASKKSFDNFEEFIGQVLRKVKASPLSLNLSNKVSASIKESHDLRTSYCSGEFTEERYPEPGLFTTGVGKDNIASYNTFASGFENSLRDILDNLKDSFKSECKKEVNALISELSTTSHVDKTQMEYLRNSLINSLLTKKVNRANVIVQSKRLSSIPAGSQRHWDKFRMHFLETYDDKYLSDIDNNLFSELSETARYIDYTRFADEELNNLRKNIEDAINRTPEQKNIEKGKVEGKIKSLEEELATLITDIKLIDELTKTVKSNV